MYQHIVILELWHEMIVIGKESAISYVWCERAALLPARLWRIYRKTCACSQHFLEVSTPSAGTLRSLGHLFRWQKKAM